MGKSSQRSEAHSDEEAESSREAPNLMAATPPAAYKDKPKSKGRAPLGLTVESLVGSLALWREAQAMFAKLSRREIQVLDLVAHGLTTKEIGEFLGISRRTVDIHRAHIIVKLGARSTADAVRIAMYAAFAGASPIGD